MVTDIGVYLYQGRFLSYMLEQMLWSKRLQYSPRQLNSPWMTGESQWLRWSCFEPFCFGWGRILFCFGGGWLVCGGGGDSGFGIPICASPKDESRSRETQVVTLRWWARCGVLNGSPGDRTTHKHTSYTHNMQNNTPEHRLQGSTSTSTPN